MLLCCRFPKHVAAIAYKLSSLWSLKHTFRFNRCFDSEILKSPNLKLLDNLREDVSALPNSPFFHHLLLLLTMYFLLQKMATLGAQQKLFFAFVTLLVLLGNFGAFADYCESGEKEIDTKFSKKSRLSF